MTRPLLLLPIEIKVREFHGKLLFAALAAEAGFDTVLGGQNYLMQGLPFLDRGIYIDKSVAVTKTAWFKRCHQLGNRVAAWDEEGLIFLSESFYLENRVAKASLAQANPMFVWGEVQAAALKTACPDLSDRLVLAGNPRFDLLRPEFRGFYTPAARKLQQTHGRIILVNTNFGHYNHFKGLEESRRILDRYPIARVKDFVDGWIDYQKRGLEAFVAALPGISRTFPGHTIIVRPSPSENRETWQKAVAGLANARVAWDGNVLEWIHAAEAVLHFNCTTGLEAFLLDVPPVALHSGQDDRFEPILPKAVSVLTSTPDAAIEALREAVAGRCAALTPENKARVEPLVQRYVHSHGRAPAGETILAALKGVHLDKPRRRNAWERLIQAKNEAWPTVLKWTGILETPHDAYESQKYGGLSVAEIQEALASFRSASGRFHHVQALPAGEQKFLITAREGGA